MATYNSQSKGAILERARALAAGTAKEIGPNVTLMVAGASMTAQEIHAKLYAVEQLFRAVQQARGAVILALGALHKALPGLTLFMTNYEAAVKGQFGVNSPKLWAFGIKPPRVRRARTVAEKLVSQARAALTRARNREAKIQTATASAPAGAGSAAPTPSSGK